MAFWQIFQKWYDKIDAWDWTPEMKVTIQKLNDKLPSAIADAILGYIKSQYAHSEDMARMALKGLSEKIDEALK